MKVPRRQFLRLAAGASALSFASRVTKAQIYPTRPVRVIVPFAPAGTTDILARLIGQWLSERLGQSFIIENRPGASTMIGTEAVVHSPADGHTLLVFGTGSAINETLYENKITYDFLRDIAPVAGILRVPNVVVVHPSLPVRTIPAISWQWTGPDRSSCRTSAAWFRYLASVDRVHQDRQAACFGCIHACTVPGAAGPPERERVCSRLRIEWFFWSRRPQENVQ